MVVEQQRGITLAGQLAVDRWWRAVDFELPGLEAGGLQQGLDQVRSLAERPLLG